MKKIIKFENSVKSVNELQDNDDFVYVFCRGDGDSMSILIHEPGQISFSNSSGWIFRHLSNPLHGVCGWSSTKKGAIEKAMGYGDVFQFDNWLEAMKWCLNQ